jgi:hypothetical protein
MDYKIVTKLTSSFEMTATTIITIMDIRLITMIEETPTVGLTTELRPLLGQGDCEVIGSKVGRIRSQGNLRRVGNVYIYS